MVQASWKTATVFCPCLLCCYAPRWKIMTIRIFVFGLHICLCLSVYLFVCLQSVTLLLIYTRKSSSYFLGQFWLLCDFDLDPLTQDVCWGHDISHTSLLPLPCRLAFYLLTNSRKCSQKIILFLFYSVNCWDMHSNKTVGCVANRIFHEDCLLICTSSTFPFIMSLYRDERNHFFSRV